jgi:hypothetical protein
MDLIRVDGDRVDGDSRAGMRHTGGCGCSHLQDVEYKGCAHSVFNAINAENPPTPFAYLKLEELHHELLGGKITPAIALERLNKRAKDFSIIVDHMTELSQPDGPSIQFTTETRQQLKELIAIFRDEIEGAIGTCR